MVGRGMAIVFVVLAFVGGVSGLILENVWLTLYLFTSLLWVAFFTGVISEVIALLARIEHNTRK